MSALPPIADIRGYSWNVCFVPIGDIMGFIRSPRRRARVAYYRYGGALAFAANCSLLLRTQLVEPLERQTNILTVFRIRVDVLKLTH
jgi:hypothetical protein